MNFKIQDSTNTVRVKILEYNEEKTKDMKLEIKSRFDKRCNASKRNRRFSTLNVCITKLIKSIKNT